jgi:glutamate racemase
MEVAKLYPDVTVTAEACPMWVPIVENDEANGDGADYFVKKYIDNLLTADSKIDTIILGCTHYPLLLPKIRQFTPPHIRLLPQGNIVADSLADYLVRHPEMERRCTRGGSCNYFTTEAEEKFRESASIFLSEQVEARHITLEQ